MTAEVLVMPTSFVQSGNCQICGTEVSLEAGKHPSLEEINGEPVACPYKGLLYSDLRAYHDNLFFDAWRVSEVNIYDLERTYHKLGVYLEMLENRFRETLDECCRKYLEKARDMYFSGDPLVVGYEGVLSLLDGILSLAHSLFNCQLRQRGAGNHHSLDYSSYYETAMIPFWEEV